MRATSSAPASSSAARTAAAAGMRTCGRGASPPTPATGRARPGGGPRGAWGRSAAIGGLRVRRDPAPMARPSMCHGTRGLGASPREGGGPAHGGPRESRPGGAGEGGGARCRPPPRASRAAGAGVTREPLWEECRGGAGAEGSAAAGCASFCRGCKRRVTGRNVTNHLGHRPGHGGGPVGPDRGAGERGDRRGRQGPPVRRRPALLAARMRRGHGGHEAGRRAALPCPCPRALRRRGRQMRLRQPQDLRRQASPRGRGRAQRGLRVPGAPPHVRVMPTGARRPRQKPSAEGSAGDIAAAIARPRDQVHSVK